jgi:quercetin dioxygenase-like cupin family protein
MPNARDVWMPGALRVEIQLTGEDTGGAFCLFTDHPQPGWALPPHRHANESETIYVVEGHFAMDVGGESLELGPGDVAHVPAGVLHSGGTVGDEPGRRVVIFSPAGIEAFFLEVGGASRDDEPDLTRLIELATEHGWSFGGE